MNVFQIKKKKFLPQLLYYYYFEIDNINARGKLYL